MLKFFPLAFCNYVLSAQIIFTTNYSDLNKFLIFMVLYCCWINLFLLKRKRLHKEGKNMKMNCSVVL